jgi:hypothetical protein
MADNNLIDLLVGLNFGLERLWHPDQGKKE